jgi:hypothetical protein
LCLIISTLSHYSSYGKHISFSLFHYVYSLVKMARSIRWSEIFLRQFCFSLDHHRVVLNGMRFFPLLSVLFTLFFERVHATWLIVPHFSSRPMLDAHMHMWG